MAIQVSTIQVRGKLGNAVGYKRSGARRSGANFARVYTDVVRDAQTASQLYQRAIAATVAKAYAAMSRICDHSFQGSAVGAMSMQRFYSLNLNQLRRDVMRDLSDPVTDPVDMLGSVVAPRSAFPTCYAYVVSEGTLTNNIVRVESIDARLCVTFPTMSGVGITLSQWCRQFGFVRGDIFTALGLGVLDPEGAFASQFGQLASQPCTSFGFIRFKLKDSALSSEEQLSEVAINDVFDIEYGGQASVFAYDEVNGAAVFCDSITGGDDGFIGVIRSRRNSPLRSSCRLQGTLTDGTVSEESKYGIKSAYLLNAWLPEQDTLGQSSLILEGGSLNGNVVPEPAPAPDINDLVGKTFNYVDIPAIAAAMQSLSVGSSLAVLMSGTYTVITRTASGWDVNAIPCGDGTDFALFARYIAQGGDPAEVTSVVCNTSEVRTNLEDFIDEIEQSLPGYDIFVASPFSAQYVGEPIGYYTL